MDATELRHAYAVLGLSPPVSEPRLKQRYKVLVRRWHPDRFQNDPAGQAEAAVRLRNINIAYEAVLASLGLEEPPQNADPPIAPPPVAPPTVKRPFSTGGRGFSLSPEQIDGIVDSINRNNRMFPPESALERRVSLAVVFGYFVAAVILQSTGGPGLLIFSRLILYFVLPLYLIWVHEDPYAPSSIILRVLGWLLMAAPAMVLLVWWIRS